MEKISKIKESNNKVNYERLCVLLVQLQGIENFMDYNKIDILYMYYASKSFEYITLEKDDIIFYQGERSDSFYIVIDGTVDIIYHYPKDEFVYNEYLNNQLKEYQKTKARNLSVLVTNEKSSNKKNLELRKNIELFPENYYNQRKVVEFKDGQSFGDWGLIYHQRRSTTARISSNYAKLIKINEKCFKNFLSNQVLKSDLDRKMFIKKRFPFMAALQHSMFQKTYIDFTPIVRFKYFIFSINKQMILYLLKMIHALMYFI